MNTIVIRLKNGRRIIYTGLDLVIEYEQKYILLRNRREDDIIALFCSEDVSVVMKMSAS